MTLDQWLDRLCAYPDMLRMGHHQRLEDRNLGLGWVYYGLARAVRARHAVSIGSFRGFVPLVLGRALQDNLENGRVTFIDPSLVDDFWKDADAVEAHFRSFGVDNVTHHLATTQDFRGSDADHAIEAVDLLFVDGFHTAEQARYDYETFADRLTDSAYVFFHDSVRHKRSRLYGDDAVYDHSVVDYMDELKAQDGLELIDLPLSSGVTLMRRVPAG